MLFPRYLNSHALVIGINQYQKASALRYAVHDAKEVAGTLENTLSFPKQNIHLLVDSEATRAAILERFLTFASDATDENDRVVVFFAGHGITVNGSRGDAGFLMPCDGDAQNLATLIRWDSLTRDTDLIPAKHILFIMDACYGGLAITRALKPGSMRFQRDMLMRCARQVLTAGKANEVVADSGGPLPNHSVFTGHFIEALQGKAESVPGFLTANGVISYVYQAVSADHNSQQTPHFGYLNGDGDMILKAPFLSDGGTSEQEERKDEDMLFSVPSVSISGQADTVTDVEQVKEMLSEERFRLKLHDRVSQQVREVLSQTADDYFPLSGAWSPEQFVERLKKYEEVLQDLLDALVLIAYWGGLPNRTTISLPFKHLAGRLAMVSGTTAWINLRWYPINLMLYSGGIAAVAARKYEHLYSMFYSSVPDQNTLRGGDAIVLGASTNAMTELDQAFKTIPRHERNRVPRSEYLFKVLQPRLDDLLFLGTDYEEAFDRFELLYALEFVHRFRADDDGAMVWGPIGRFGWKVGRGEGGPFNSLVREAEKLGSSWGPINAGLFGGEVQRFREVAAKFSQFLSRLNWW